MGTVTAKRHPPFEIKTPPRLANLSRLGDLLARLAARRFDATLATLDRLDVWRFGNGGLLTWASASGATRTEPSLPWIGPAVGPAELPRERHPAVAPHCQPRPCAR